MITIATPLSAVSTMQSLSLLSSLIAKFWALVRLGLGGWEALSTQFISALSSSASCWLSLVQAASIAVIYSKVGGCSGVTTKLGPLASTDLCAGVKGLLIKLISLWGRVLFPREDWELPAWEDWGLAAWEVALSAKERVLSARGAWGLPAWEIVLRALFSWALGVKLPACKALVARVTCLLFAWGEGPSGWENLRAMPSYTSFLFIYLLDYSVFLLAFP